MRLTQEQLILSQQELNDGQEGQRRERFISYIDLSHGNFARVIFIDSNLSFADLTATDLRRADLSSTRLEGIRGSDKALTDEATIWP